MRPSRSSGGQLPVSNHDDAARHVRKQPPRKIGDGLRRDGDDDNLCCLGGAGNGNGRRADSGRQRGPALRSPRVRDRDLVAEPGEEAGKCASHGSGADDSDFHTDSPFESTMRARLGGGVARLGQEFAGR